MKTVLLTIALLGTSAIANPITSSEGITSLLVIQEIRQNRIAPTINKVLRKNRVVPTNNKLVRQNRIVAKVKKTVRSLRVERVARISIYKKPLVSKITSKKMEHIASR